MKFPKIEFFKPKDYFGSWSTWILGAITVAPVIDNTGVIEAIVPPQHRDLALSILGIVGLILRAIKQKSKYQEEDKTA